MFPAKTDINIALVIFANINQKEEVIPEIQALGLLGPDGLPNTEKFQWKSIPQGAEMYAALLIAKYCAHLSGTVLLLQHLILASVVCATFSLVVAFSDALKTSPVPTSMTRKLRMR
jgi:hypothetical protein